MTESLNPDSETPDVAITNADIVQAAESGLPVETRITVGMDGAPERGYDQAAALARAQAANARVLAEFAARPPQAIPQT